MNIKLNLNEVSKNKIKIIKQMKIKSNKKNPLNYVFYLKNSY